MKKTNFTINVSLFTREEKKNDPIDRTRVWRNSRKILIEVTRIEIVRSLLKCDTGFDKVNET